MLPLRGPAAGILQGLLAGLLAEEFLLFPHFSPARFGGLLVVLSLLDLLQGAFFGHGALEALHQFFGRFPVSQGHSNQTTSLQFDHAMRRRPGPRPFADK